MKFSQLLLVIAVLAITIHAAPDSPVTRVTPPAPQFSDVERQTELAKRRAVVAAKMQPNSMLMLMSAEPRLYTNDVDYVYRQENDLYYLTMLKKEGATLILMPGSATPEILFAEQRTGRTAIYNGFLYTPPEAAKISGVKTVLDAKELPAFLAAMKKRETFTSTSGVSVSFKAENLYLVLPNAEFDQIGQREYNQEFEFAKTLATATFDKQNGRYDYAPQFGYKIQNAGQIFADLRLVKSVFEQKMLQHAIDITTEAQIRAWAAAAKADYEYEVQAEVEYTFRRRNADFWGYPSIVGCGPNATTLHYVESQGKIGKNDLLLMDVGAEYEHYSADVTRTFPINGKFSKEQAEIYQIVYDAQEAIAKITKPGASMIEANAAADKIYAPALAKLGLIESPTAVFTRQTPDGKTVQIPQYKIWALHGTSHWLGMNVHDVGAFNHKFEAGNIFTNEPGIYIRADALDNLPDTPDYQKFKAFARPAFEKYKNIGVRIEDDMLVTTTGCEWLTKNLPRSIPDVEKTIAAARREFSH